MHLLEIDEVIKASPAIQIQSKITHLQRRAWNVLLANAYDELPDREIHYISVAELAQCLGYGSNDHSYLKETLKALVDCIVEWNVLGKDKKGEWGVAALLASAKIANGICAYSFAPHLRYKLYNPRIYTKINLRLQNQFTSRYAVILWEVCFDYFDIARNEGETQFIPLGTFRVLMGLEGNEYRTFNVMNRDVIKPAIEEVNTLTNFSIEVEYRRIGRKVGELKFRISRDRDVLVLPPAQESDAPALESHVEEIEDLPAIAIALVKAGVSRKEALRIAELQWDFVDEAVLPENRSDFDLYIEEKIGLAHYTTDVKNVGGFIVKAIQENYQDPKFQKQFEAAKKQERQVLIRQLRKEKIEKRNTLIRQAVRDNPELLERAADRITSDFTLEVLTEYESVQEAYGAGVLIRGELNTILANEICVDLVAPINAFYDAELERLEKTSSAYASP